MSKAALKSDGKNRQEVLERGEKWRLYKNLFVISFAFMIHFTAFHGTANLQSSINSSQSLGALTLAAIYGSLLLSNILLPVLVIGWLGLKWTIALSFIAYMPFIGAQFLPAIYTLIPAGLLVGLGGGPLWCAKCTYLTVAADSYAEKTATASDVLVTKFFGVFFMFYQLAQVWGNLISSTVLSMADPLEESLSSTTQSLVIQVLKKTDEILANSTVREFGELCGANFTGGAQEESNPNLNPPSAFKRNLLAGIFLACMIAAVLCVTFGVDSIERCEMRDAKPKESILKGLMATLKQTADPYQLLLLPATMFIGAEQAFLAAEFNAAFVACAWGIEKIGFVMICFGVFNAIGAVATGAASKVAGRYPVMVVALILHLGLIGALLVWRPNPNQYLGFFIIASVWGLVDSIWLILVNSMSGILFPGREEASFANFRLWESTGSVIIYSFSAYARASHLIYISTFILLLGFMGYIAVEILEVRAKRGLTIDRGFKPVSTKDPVDPVDQKSRELQDFM